MSKLVSLALVVLAAVSAISGSPVKSDHLDLQKRVDPVPSPTVPTLSRPPASSPTPGDDDDCEGDDEDDYDTDDDINRVDGAVYSPVPGTPTPNPTYTPDPTFTPVPTSTPIPTSTPDTPEPSPTPDVSTSSETHPDGHVTWYTQDGNYGACGEKHSDNDFIAALDSRTYGGTGANSKYCGKKIRVSWQGKSVDVTVQDVCPGCFNAASVDLSTAAFKVLAPLDVGLLTGATWELL